MYWKVKSRAKSYTPKEGQVMGSRNDDAALRFKGRILLIKLVTKIGELMECICN